MRVSSRADYGVRALYDLARHHNQGPVQSRDIAARQRVPEAYLHQVLGALNRAGLVRSTRGPMGGHVLAREPEDVSLWDILLVLDGPDPRAHPHPQRRGRAPGENGTGDDAVHAVWHELQCRSIDYLRSISLATLVERGGVAATEGTYSI